MRQRTRPIALIWVAIAYGLCAIEARAADPPSTPYPRTETGMHTASVKARYTSLKASCASGAYVSAMALEGYALLEGLSKAADDQGQIQVGTLADFIGNLVPEITLKKWGYEQSPTLEIRGQTFPIARKPAH